MKKILSILSVAAMLITIACSEDNDIIPYEVRPPHQDPFTLNMDIDGMPIDSAMAANASASCSEKGRVDIKGNEDGTLSVEMPLPNSNIRPDVTVIQDTILEYRRQYELNVNINKKRVTFDVTMLTTVHKGCLYGTNIWEIERISMNNRNLEFTCDRKILTCFIKLKFAGGKISPSDQ